MAENVRTKRGTLKRKEKQMGYAYEQDEDDECVVKDKCLDCKNFYIEDIWYEGMCKISGDKCEFVSKKGEVYEH